jgi:hypothetical protein
MFFFTKNESPHQSAKVSGNPQEKKLETTSFFLLYQATANKPFTGSGKQIQRWWCCSKLFCIFL